jgi:hypothetical protein
LRLVVVILGILLAVYGAFLMLPSRRGGTDEQELHRAKWRTRRGVALIIIAGLLVLFGLLVVPLSDRLAVTGPGGVLLLIFLNVIALALDAIALVFIFFNGVSLASVSDLNEPWLVRARHRTRYGVVLLFGAFLAQLGGVALILF